MTPIVRIFPLLGILVPCAVSPLVAWAADLSTPEWTAEQARAAWKPVVRPVVHVGIPGYQWQAGVLWDGSLLFGPPKKRLAAKILDEEAAGLGKNETHISIGYGDPMRFVDRHGTGSPAIRHSLLQNRSPIPQITTNAGDGLQWEQTVFSNLLGRKPQDGMSPRSDDMLVVHSIFKVSNPLATPQKAHLWLYFGDLSHTKLNYKVGIAEQIDDPFDHEFDVPWGWVEQRSKVRYVIPRPSQGTLLWHDEVPAPPGMKDALKRVIEWTVDLAPGERAELRLLVPYGVVDRETAQRTLTLDSAALIQEVVEYWNKLLTGPSTITLPDAWFKDYAYAMPAYMAQQVVYRTKANVWMYKTSPNVYEKFWLVCGGKAMPSLDLRGLTQISRPAIQAYIDRSSDDPGNVDHANMGQGKKVVGEGYARHAGYLGNYGEWTANPIIWGHGVALWNLAAHYRITRDKTWLSEGKGSPLQTILDACDWLTFQRRRTMREENGHRVPHWGLLPAASTHDWLAGTVIINDAFCINGMAEAVRMLRELQHPRAESIAKELNDWRTCLRDDYRAVRNQARRLPLPNGSEIPFVPRCTSELDWAKVDWTYTDYGPSRAGALGALDPGDELIDQAIAFVEAGMPKGEGFYTDFRPDSADVSWADVNDRNADRHYLWRHYVDYEVNWPMTDLFLQRDDLPRFFECFFNAMAVIDHDWMIGTESIDGVPACAPGEGERWRAIRNMFVNERGGHDGSAQELFLLQAVPRSWLKPGAHLAAKDMRTHLGGRVDLEVQVADSGASVRVSANIDVAALPSGIRMRLRSGDGRPLVSATINDIKTPVGDKDSIVLPTGTRGRYTIVGRFD